MKRSWFGGFGVQGLTDDPAAQKPAKIGRDALPLVCVNR